MAVSSPVMSYNYLTTLTDIKDLRELRDMFLPDWPKHCVHYYCLDNFVRWLEREPSLQNFFVYTLNNQWRETGLYMVVDRYQLFVGALDEQYNDQLAEALSLLDWARGFKVSSFLERHRPPVLEVVKRKELQLEYDSLTVMYYMTAAEAAQLQVNCPAGYEVRPLSVDDAKTIDDAWPNRHNGSFFLIKRLIAWNISMGVYSTTDNQLVAWCLRLQGGFLGALQVAETHKRQGLGSLVARAISRRIASELGHDVMALVGKENLPSNGMFQKLGFKIIDTCYWLRNCERYRWPENE